MPDDDSFSDAPLAIDELRAMKSDRASDITPRSAIVEVLRAIDRGEMTIDVLVICMRYRDHDGETRHGFRVASPDPTLTIGTVARVLHLLNAP